MSTGESIDEDARFLFPDDSEEESWLELPGEDDETADRVWKVAPFDDSISDDVP